MGGLSIGTTFEPLTLSSQKFEAPKVGLTTVVGLCPGICLIRNSGIIPFKI